MWKLRGCTKCGGDIMIDNDHYGWYVQCLQCGSLWELAELLVGEKQTPHNRRVVTNRYTRR